MFVGDEMALANKIAQERTHKDPNPLTHVKYEHLIAGLSSGVTSTLALHPLDVMMVRFAVCDGRSGSTPKYNGIRNAFDTIIKQEGVRGLYKGLIPNMWASGMSWGIYFLLYDAFKMWIRDGDTTRPLSAGQYWMAASQATVITSLFTNPFWVIKTRLSLQYDASHEIYNGMMDALVKIYKNEGLRGYYKGFIPSLFSITHGAVQFTVYEELKYYCNLYRHVQIDTQLNTTQYLTFAAVSKLIAASLTYPYQIVRIRLQNQFIPYNGALDCIKQTWHYEGWNGFYKGLGTNLLRVTPATMITFITYENVSYLLTRK